MGSDFMGTELCMHSSQGACQSDPACVWEQDICFPNGRRSSHVEITELDIPMGDIVKNRGKYLISSEVVDPKAVMSVTMHYGVAIDNMKNGKMIQTMYFLGDNDGIKTGSRLIGEWDGTYIAIK